MPTDYPVDSSSGDVIYPICTCDSSITIIITSFMCYIFAAIITIFFVC